MLQIVKSPRKMILELISNLDIEQLNKIPAGFNNNIAWNLGHMIAAQQGICYKRSGLEAKVNDDFFNKYKPGSKPETFITAEEFEEIKELLMTTLDELDADYNAGTFKSYTPVMTRYNIELANIDDAFTFVPFHEGLHIGYIMSLRKLV